MQINPTKDLALTSRLRLELQSKLELLTNNIQDDVLACLSRFIIFIGARRVGKSYTGAKYVLPFLFMPSTRGWIVAPKYETGRKEFLYLLEFYQKAVKRFNLPPLDVLRDNWRAGDVYMRTAWGSEVQVKSGENPKSLISEELDWVIMAECAELAEEHWTRRIYGCLTDRKGIAFFSSTPHKKARWIYDIIKSIMLSQRLGISTDWSYFICSAEDTPHYDKEELARAKNNLPPEIYEEQFGAKWFFGVGRLYPNWNADIHVVTDEDIAKMLSNSVNPMAIYPTVIGYDFGGTVSPTAGVFVQYFPTINKFIAMYEYYAKELPTKTHLQMLEPKIALTHARAMVCDNNALGNQLMLDVRKYFGKRLPVIGAGKDVLFRRDLLFELFHPKSDANPTVYVHRNCANLIFELDNATIDEYGKVKGDNHAITGLEMAVEHLVKLIRMPTYVARRRRYDLSGCYSIPLEQRKEEQLNAI